MTTFMTVSKSHYPSMDDASLAQHARTDPQAFAELYHRHVRSIYRYHLAHTGNVRDAEDLTSQTFMAALEGRLVGGREGVGNVECSIERHIDAISADEHEALAHSDSHEPGGEGAGAPVRADGLQRGHERL